MQCFWNQQLKYSKEYINKIKKIKNERRKKINSHSIHFPCHISSKRHRIHSFTSTPILPPPDIFPFFILNFLTNLQPIAPISILFWLCHQHPTDRIFFSFRPRSLFRLDAVSIIYIQSRKGKLEMRVLDHGRSSLVVVLSPFKAQFFSPAISPILSSSLFLPYTVRISLNL